jgi:hypothetical protein
MIYSGEGSRRLKKNIQGSRYKYSTILGTGSPPQVLSSVLRGPSLAGSPYRGWETRVFWRFDLTGSGKTLLLSIAKTMNCEIDLIRE